MKTRTLGRTGMQASEISLGTWAFASQVYGDVSEKMAHEAVAAALDAGINLFDTAPLYGTAERSGTAEEILGRALGARSGEVLVSTKFGRSSVSPAPDFTARRARSSVEESLARLGRGHIDILFFHSPFSPDEIHDDVWAELDKLKAEGKIRAVGHSISMFDATQGMAREWVADGRIDLVQVLLSLMNRESLGLIRDVAAAGAGVITRECLGNGFLTGAVKRDTVFPANNLNSRYSREEIIERVDYVESLGFLVRGDIADMPQAAMRWCLDQAGVSTVLTGAKNAQEVASCAAASDAAPFAPEELAKAAALHTKEFPHA